MITVQLKMETISSAPMVILPSGVALSKAKLRALLAKNGDVIIGVIIVAFSSWGAGRLSRGRLAASGPGFFRRNAFSVRPPGPPGRAIGRRQFYPRFRPSFVRWAR